MRAPGSDNADTTFSIYGTTTAKLIEDLLYKYCYNELEIPTSVQTPSVDTSSVYASSRCQQCQYYFP